MKTAAIGLVWLAVVCAALLVAVLVAVTLFQDRLLYFPARAAVGEMATGTLRPWPSPQEFRGLVAEPAGVVRGTAIVFHGNAGHAGHRGFYAQALNPLGLRVILAEYPGYGPREGALGESSLVADAEESIALAHRQHGAPLLVIGESLGAGVAAAASARQQDKVAGLMLITPWDTLANVAYFHYPWLPVRWLLRDRYDSTAHLAHFNRPTLLVVAEQDKIVPAHRGIALHGAMRGAQLDPQQAATPRNLPRLERISLAGHNDWPARVDDAWWRNAVTFLLQGAPPP